MGCGKSSVGREIASRLGCPFTDLDEFIEKKQGRSVAEIFSSEGEAGFRAIELEALMEVLSSYEGGTMYIALGGGTLTIPDARPLLRACTRLIYLRASVSTLVENLTLTGLSSRPLLSGLSSSTPAPGFSVSSVPAETALAPDRSPSSPPAGAVPAGRPVVDTVDEVALRRRVEALLSERSALYEETADVVIDIDGLSTPAIADLLLALPPAPPTPSRP